MEANFFERVYAVVRQIPRGKVCSYGLIAEYLGSKRSSRMVGWAMNASHHDDTIPAHRVVNRNGLLTGKSHFGNIYEMENRLLEEGIEVKENQIVSLEKHLWNPNKELNSFNNEE